MFKLNPCPVCGKQPVAYTSSVAVVGCEFSAFIVECDADNDGSQIPPFIEHQVCVYGKDETEARERWNQMGSKE